MRHSDEFRQRVVTDVSVQIERIGVAIRRARKADGRFRRISSPLELRLGGAPRLLLRN